MNFWHAAVRTSLSSMIHSAKPARALVTCGLLLVFAALAMLASAASAQPLAQSTGGGKEIFDQKCTGCHTIGSGKLVGPDLKDVTKRRDVQWIKNMILDPTKMLATDPVAMQLLKDSNNIAMPVMGLTAAQVDQVIEYLSGAGPSAAAPAAAPAASAAGNAENGRRLFTGELSLAKGGPHCLACHTVSGEGWLGGGGLGPDLTHVVGRLGEPGLAGALRVIAFPTMLGPFQNSPLTAQEQADLVAFLKAADAAQPPVADFAAGALNQNTLLVFGISLGIAVILFVCLGVIWAQIARRIAPRLPVRKV